MRFPKNFSQKKGPASKFVNCFLVESHSARGHPGESIAEQILESDLKIDFLSFFGQKSSVFILDGSVM